MAIRVYQVDAFTNRPFRGNPAAVCPLTSAREEQWMQAVAREMNLSETAFLVPDGIDHKLRWFTPTVEVDLCGHATLASAHVLWEQGLLPEGEIARFQTRSGLLTAVRAGELIAMDFPCTPPESTQIPAGLAEALGVTPVEVGKSRFDYLVQVANDEEVRELRPDFQRLRGLGLRGVIVTAESADPEYDFVSRFFAPGSGIDEDPVTGSAHCTLAPYWAQRLGKDSLVGYQASARGGVVRVRHRGQRVTLAGQAVTVLSGELSWASESVRN